MTEITIDMLVKEGACTDQQAVFMEHFPDGKVDVTREVVEKYVDEFDWDWAGRRLLSGRSAYRFAYAREKILAAYYRGIDTVHRTHWYSCTGQYLGCTACARLRERYTKTRWLDTARLFVDLLNGAVQ